MGDHDDAFARQPSTPPNRPSPFVDELLDGFAPHPLFAEEGQARQLGNICFLAFRRKRPDGRVEHAPEDYDASEIQSWGDVVRSTTVSRWRLGERLSAAA
jgi:hypothetical protein